MPQGFWYWLILVGWIILSLIGYFDSPAPRKWYNAFIPVVVFILFIIIGVSLYGGAYHNLVK